VGAHELPPAVVLVADLTSEFAAARDIVRGSAAYRSLPTLDAAAPPNPRVFDDLVRALAGASAPVYVHCALGHGRSALVVAAVLVARGLANDAARAEALIKAARPGVGLNKAQRAFLSKWCAANSTKDFLRDPPHPRQR
jgi:protein-tyrosine phosphatase